MYRHITKLLPIALAATACSDTPAPESSDGESLQRDYTIVENRTDVDVVVDGNDDEPASDADIDREVRFRCDADGRHDLTTRVTDDGVLIIEGDADADCYVLFPAFRVTDVVIDGQGDLDIDRTWFGLHSVEMKGQGTFHADHIVSSDLAFVSHGGATADIDHASVGYVFIDMSGNSELSIDDGASDEADISLSGNAALYARGFEVDEATVDATGNATAELTVLDLLSGSVDGNADVSLWGDAEIDGDLDITLN